MITKRPRTLAVLLTLAGGALALIASTQTWFDVVLVEAPDTPLAVSGAAALPVLAPLALAALALGLVLALSGRVLGTVLAVLGVVLGALLAALTAPIAFSQPLQAVASTVTQHTGIAGAGVDALVASFTPTAWPVLAVVASAIVLAGAAFALATVSRWASGGRRYRVQGDAAASVAPSDAQAGAAAATPVAEPNGAVDAFDAWDGLSRGDDPTRG